MSDPYVKGNVLFYASVGHYDCYQIVDIDKQNWVLYLFRDRFLCIHANTR